MMVDLTEWSRDRVWAFNEATVVDYNRFLLNKARKSGLEEAMIGSQNKNP